MSSTRNIILIGSDGESFEVDEKVAVQSRTISKWIEETGCPDNGFPLPEVTSRILSKVIAYCKKHVVDANGASSVAGGDCKAWDAEFVKVDDGTLRGLLMAAKYLGIQGLMDLTIQTLADRIKGKTPDEIAKTLGIKSDLTPEEKEKIRRENSWAFESKRAFSLWPWSCFTHGN